MSDARNMSTKSSEIIFIRKNIRLKYLPKQHLLIQLWESFISSADFRETIDFTLQFAQSNSIKYLISDTQKQAAISPTDSAYAANAMPALYKSGLKGFAFIIPENIFTKLSLKKFSDMEPTETVQYFWNFEDALQWIHELEENQNPNNGSI